jgi:hypothetical protein
VLLASCAESQDDLGPTGGASGFGALGGAAGSGGAADASSDGSGASGATGGAAGSGGSAGGGSGGTGGGSLEGSVDGASCVENTPESTCGTSPQCGCESGQKCDVTLLSTGKATCVGDDGTAPSYAGCFIPGLGCTKGNACVGSVCKPYCTSLADCPGQNRQCVPVQFNDNGVAKNVPGMSVCSAGCDPVDPGAVCASNLTCSFVQTGGYADCFPAGTAVGIGQCSATSANVCAPGYLCVDNSGSYDCLKWCRMSNPNDCASGQFCQGLQSTPVINGVQYGVCT